MFFHCLKKLIVFLPCIIGSFYGRHKVTGTSNEPVFSTVFLFATVLVAAVVGSQGTK